MTLRAVRYVMGSAVEGPHRWRIDAGTPEALAATTAGPRPAAYVLPGDDLAAAAAGGALAGTIVDRGTKNPTRPLAARLLGARKIPVIHGSYREPGQLQRGVRALLRSAHRAGEQQVYLIGVAPPLFDTLWRRSGVAAAAAVTEGGAQGEGGAAEILRMLPRLEVPERLEREFVGVSPGSRLVRQLILHAARTREPVLIQGETGTGKELVARSIHEHGPRRAYPFMPVNCGAIPGELLESELFGHVRGAFTHAVAAKEGLWKVAGEGTLLLDEIGDLRMDHQAKILRALQENRVRPVGGKTEVVVRARILAATSRDLYAMVRAGEFRSDLYYRLRTFLIRTPGLGADPENVRPLAQHFWGFITRDSVGALPGSVLTVLEGRTWPGNARELRSVLALMHSLFRDEDPTPTHLRVALAVQGHGDDDGIPPRVQARLVRLLRRDALLRLEDIVRASRVTLEPLGRRGSWLEQNAARVAEALRRRLEELRALLDARSSGGETPALPPRAYEVASRLRLALVELGAELELDARAARRRWREEASLTLAATQEVVEEEVRSVDRG